jgi:hypothetical protein
MPQVIQRQKKRMISLTVLWVFEEDASFAGLRNDRAGLEIAIDH